MASEPASFTSSWGNPDGAGQVVVSKLEDAAIRTGYADYWVAYKLDFLAKGRLSVTTAGYEDDRSQTINAAVVHSQDPAWIFVPPSAATKDGTQFTAPSLIVGPDTVTEGQFTATLQRLGISYRVIDVGLARAVVPSRAVTPFEAGLPGAIPG